MDWKDAILEADLIEGEGVFARVEGLAVALFLSEGDLFAIDDACPHSRTAQLSQGFVDGTMVECPLHQSCFDLRTGKVQSPPATEDVRTWPTRIVDGMVQIGL